MAMEGPHGCTSGMIHAWAQLPDEHFALAPPPVQHTRHPLPNVAAHCAQTPLALLKRAQQPGGMADLQDILPRWKPWQPPKLDQVRGAIAVCQGM